MVIDSLKKKFKLLLLDNVFGALLLAELIYLVVCRRIWQKCLFVQIILLIISTCPLTGAVNFCQMKYPQLI